jgi:hypothetical protein
MAVGIGSEFRVKSAGSAPFVDTGERGELGVVIGESRGDIVESPNSGVADRTLPAAELGNESALRRGASMLGMRWGKGQCRSSAKPESAVAV